jgi:hypothetical protein
VMIRVTPNSFYNIGTGRLLDNAGDKTKLWIILDWEIRANSQPTDSPALFTFRAPKTA